MQTTIIPTDNPQISERQHVITVTIKSFKGRRNVEAHLFRPHGDNPPLTSCAIDWENILGAPIDPANPGNEEDAQKMVLETFTEAERDMVIEYLKERYASRLECITACPVQFPVPLGVAPLSEIPVGKTMGFINFDTVPNYPLEFPFKGYYDLAEHQPLEAQR